MKLSLILCAHLLLSAPSNYCSTGRLKSKFMDLLSISKNSEDSDALRDAYEIQTELALKEAMTNTLYRLAEANCNCRNYNEAMLTLKIFDKLADDKYYLKVSDQEFSSLYEGCVGSFKFHVQNYFINQNFNDQEIEDYIEKGGVIVFFSEDNDEIELDITASVYEENLIEATQLINEYVSEQ